MRMGPIVLMPWVMRTPTSTLIETLFTKSMHEWEEKLDGKLAQLTTNINHNTNIKVDAATDNIIHHVVNVQEIISNKTAEL